MGIPADEFSIRGMRIFLLDEPRAEAPKKPEKEKEPEAEGGPGPDPAPGGEPKPEAG